ncbi:MAG: lysophospholipase [Desulfobacter sp.]|nr:lysophospholipase [Desulfobacter sp.]
MGGLITAASLMDHQDKVDGAVLSSPGVKIPDHVTPATRMAARFFSWIAPGLGIKQLEASDICRDPAVVSAYVNDPLVSTGKITARLAAQMLDACERVMAGAGRITLPAIILQGGSDALVDPEGATLFHDALGSKDKTLKIYPNKFHEIFNDPGYDQVFSDMTDWLQKRI